LDLARRFAFYVLRKALLVFIVILFLGITFFSTRDVANVYIVVNEGLESRVLAILDQNIDVEFLDRFFSDSFLREDQLLSNNIYTGYNIYSYRHRIRMNFFWIWPWDNEATISVEQVVSNIIGESRNIDEGLKNPPEWESGRKLVVLIREQGRWQIDSMESTEPIMSSGE